jgi:hypothetical protein
MLRIRAQGITIQVQPILSIFHMVVTEAGASFSRSVFRHSEFFVATNAAGDKRSSSVVKRIKLRFLYIFLRDKA